MSKISLFFGNLLIQIGQLLKGKEPAKTLQVIFHFSPTFELLADYYDSSWSPRDGAMFGKVYAFRHRVLAIHEAVEYARNNNYDLLQVNTAERGKAPKTVEVMTIH